MKKPVPVRTTAEEPVDAKRSAIPPGRMAISGTVRGPDCAIPSLPGIYRHVGPTGEIDYAGQTNDLRQRQQQHERLGKLNLDKQRVAFAVAPPGTSKDALIETEKAHIARHQPSGNKTRGGNGRR
ncbi:GIY-YIG catalytic domain [Paraburkholderia piptadeniae]|uniref:GIY-YIG domain-containing protein n=2 Tax=Paraburkholderia TaxID=1822464 RepID=A0A7X1TKT7_9BURK|nr:MULTISPECIES: hypothetical protein [Paraburkholderia]MPW23052.1 hypothetical protein [Paraburkholderia franconis]SIT51990.1 GIY-YIG catalytic domain [Paraburkholderia piptadeniae]